MLSKITWRSSEKIIISWDYLTGSFDCSFKKNCISVRDGAVLSIEEAIERDPNTMAYKSRTSRDWWGMLNVQEPFTLTNTAR